MQIVTASFAVMTVTIITSRCMQVSLLIRPTTHRAVVLALRLVLLVRLIRLSRLLRVKPSFVASAHAQPPVDVTPACLAASM